MDASAIDGFFLHAMVQTTQSRARMCIGGVKNLKIIFYVFIQKNFGKLQ